MKKFEENKDKFELIIDSAINGNWGYCKRKVKYWSKNDKRELLSRAKEIIPEEYENFINLIILGDQRLDGQRYIFISSRLFFKIII